jgi:tetratricopeptide (TPR) repeat protein
MAWFYLTKTLLPVNVSLIYPRVTVSLVVAGVCSLGWLAIAGIAWWKRASWGRSLGFGAGYFLLALLPALGLIPMAYVQHSNVADHFAYLGMVAPIVGAAALGAVLLRSVPGIRFGGTVVVAVAIVLLACGSVQRAWCFGHPEQLWRVTIAQNPAAWTAHEHLAIALYERHEVAPAAAEFRRSVELHPSNYRAWFNLGVMLRMQGREQEAAKMFGAAVALRPELLRKAN